MFHELVELVTNLKPTLVTWSTHTWFTWALFAVLFAETGLVVTPFLPGDSLLFAVGALVASGNAQVPLSQLLVVMCCAVLLGDQVNYCVGRLVGPQVFGSESSRWFNRAHLHKTQAFYEKHGAKMIVVARFVPIVRTFAPFVAGIGQMNYLRFVLFSVSGGVAWVVSLTMAGVWFGNIEWVAKHFEAVVVMIVVISVVPLVVEYVKVRRAARV